MSGVPDDLAILIADVRHDINNSLMAVFGYLELLIGHEELTPPVRTKLKNIEVEAYKIRDHIARTAFIRKPKP